MPTEVNSYTPTEIRAAGPREQFHYRNVTLASGQNLAKGTLLGIVTASGLASAYDDGNTDGTEVAVGILSKDTDASSEDTPTGMFVRGNFVTSLLTAPDTNWKADLNAREIVSLDEVYI